MDTRVIAALIAVAGVVLSVVVQVLLHRRLTSHGTSVMRESKALDEKLERTKADLQTFQNAAIKRWEAHLEQIRGDIRRDVERDLKSQEARLRLAAEIEVRLHDRSWELCTRTLKSLTQVAIELQGMARVVDQYLHHLRTNQQPNVSAIEGYHQRTMLAVSELVSACDAAPPQAFDQLRPMRNGFVEVFDVLTSVGRGAFEGDDGARNTRAVYLMVAPMITSARNSGDAAIRNWTNALWDEQRRILAEWKGDAPPAPTTPASPRPAATLAPPGQAPIGGESSNAETPAEA